MDRKKSLAIDVGDSEKYCLAVIDNCTDDPAKAAFQDKIKIMRPCILIGMPVDSACHFSFFLNRI